MRNKGKWGTFVILKEKRVDIPLEFGMMLL